MKLLKTFLIIIACLFVSCKSEKKEPNQIDNSKYEFKKNKQDLLELRNRIAKYNRVDSPNIGTGMQSPQYNSYEELLKIVTNEELRTLTKDTNNVVATYATFGLIERSDLEFLNVFERVLKGNDSVSTMNGCIVSKTLMSTEIYDKYWNKLRMESTDESNILRHDKTLLKLDSLILCSNYTDRFMYYRPLKNRKYEEKYIPIIKKLAFQNRNIEAIYYLYNNYKFEFKSEIIDALHTQLKAEDIYFSDRNKIDSIFKSYH